MAGPAMRLSTAARSPIRSALAWSASASKFWARASSNWPLSFSTSCLALRSNSDLPRLSSSLLSALDTADGVKCNSSAAAPSDGRRAALTKTRRSERFMMSKQDTNSEFKLLYWIRRASYHLQHDYSHPTTMDLPPAARRPDHGRALRAR